MITRVTPLNTLVSNFSSLKGKRLYIVPFAVVPFCKGLEPFQGTRRVTRLSRGRRHVPGGKYQQRGGILKALCYYPRTLMRSGLVRLLWVFFDDCSAVPLARKCQRLEHNTLLFLRGVLR